MTIVRLNVTDSSGTLLGVVELSADDLQHPQFIGQLVLRELPASLRPSS